MTFHGLRHTYAAAEYNSLLIEKNAATELASALTDKLEREKGRTRAIVADIQALAAKYK